MRLAVFAFVLAVAVVGTSAIDQNVAEFVVNGEDASIEDYPYMAKVWTLMLPACGGAILTQRSVLTVNLSRVNHPLDLF